MPDFTMNELIEAGFVSAVAAGVGPLELLDYARVEIEPPNTGARFTFDDETKVKVDLTHTIPVLPDRMLDIGFNPLRRVAVYRVRPAKPGEVSPEEGMKLLLYLREARRAVEQSLAGTGEAAEPQGIMAPPGLAVVKRHEA